MAQGPRPAKAHLRSADRSRTSQMSYLQKRDGPLRFFWALGLLDVSDFNEFSAAQTCMNLRKLRWLNLQQLIV